MTYTKPQTGCLEPTVRYRKLVNYTTQRRVNNLQRVNARPSIEYNIIMNFVRKINFHTLIK